LYKNNLSYPCQTCKILPNFPSRGYKISMYSPNLQLRQCQLRLQDLWTNPYKAIQIEHFWIVFWNESTKPVVQKLGLKSNLQIQIFKNQTCKSGFVRICDTAQDSFIYSTFCEDSLNFWKLAGFVLNDSNLFKSGFVKPELNLFKSRPNQNEPLKVWICDHQNDPNPWICKTNPRVYNFLIQFPQP